MISKRKERIQKYGFHSGLENADSYYTESPFYNALDWEGKRICRNPRFTATSRPKAGSHDDGPFNGPYLGGIGAPVFARDMLGYFSRWHLQAGKHIYCPMDTAFFQIWWKKGDKASTRKLRVGKDGFSADEVSYSALFPLVYETYTSTDMPFTVDIEYFSPMIPGNTGDSVLPLTMFTVHITPTDDSQPVEVAVNLCWPHLLGWRQVDVSSEERQNQYFWPTQQNAGNYAKVLHKEPSRVHIAQKRQSYSQQPQDMDGTVMLSLDCPGWDASCDGMFRESRMTTGNPDAEQFHTIGKMQADFSADGRLCNSLESWQAHWHEPVCSALAARTRLCGTAVELTFCIAMDIPVVTFGMGRSWYRSYTEQFGCDGARTMELAEYALSHKQQWLNEIDAFHTRALSESENLPEHVRGARINELYFVAGGGALVLSKPVGGYDAETSVLGTGQHFALLEGFDNGYFYYNTLDLWVYAFPSLSKNWPEFAEMVFQDYLKSAALKIEQKNMIYRTGTLEANLDYAKLPHDLGSTAEDLFVRLNGYNFRDNPNRWKDHNPSFVLAFYLHRSLCGGDISADEYNTLKLILSYTEQQDAEGAGAPRHTEMGDSTYDNLHMRGLSAYTCCLCIGAWAVMLELAKRRNIPQDVEHYRNMLDLAKSSLDTLWNGEYYIVSETGKYNNATMSDALFGVFMAQKAGITDLLPISRVHSHLQAVCKNNIHAYGGGSFGSLLVAEPGKQRYEQDGGDELQVNEVIVGSAWLLAATLLEFGLPENGESLAGALAAQIYGGSGLQFRTPAAWDNTGQYRAPMNMRPLAIWML